MATAYQNSTNKSKTPPVKQAWTVWAMPVVIGIGILFATIFVLAPQFKQLLADNEAIKVAEADLEKLVDKRTFLQGLSVSKLETQRESLERVLPSEKPVFTLIESFKILAEQEEVVIGDYSLSPGLLEKKNASAAASNRNFNQADASPGTRAYLSFDLSVDGTLDKVLSFLTSFETLAPLITVDAISINGEVERDNNDIEVSTEITMAMNFSMPPVTDPDISKSLPKITESDESVITKIDEFDTYSDLELFNQPIIEYERGNIFSY